MHKHGSKYFAHRPPPTRPWDSVCESDKNTRIHNTPEPICPFLTGDHKAAIKAWPRRTQIT